MDTISETRLAPLFQAVGDTLRQNQEYLNQVDEFNWNHGDHMVQVFQIAARAAEEKDLDMADAMDHAAQLLREQTDNGSALVYASGLEQMAKQFRNYGVGLGELVAYIRGALVEGEKDKSSAAGGGEVLKALTAGLVAWGQTEREGEPKDRLLDMGTLFEFGMAYLQAKQRGGSRIEVLADAAASVSPLSSVPHRYESGKMAIQSLLLAINNN